MSYQIPNRDYSEMHSEKEMKIASMDKHNPFFKTTLNGIPSISQIGPHKYMTEDYSRNMVLGF
jgi:hypothetical protein